MARAYQFTLLLESFRKANKYKRIERSSGFTLFSGQNEDESGPSSMAVQVEHNGKPRVVWATIAFPDEFCLEPDSSRQEIKAAKNHSMRAIAAWKRAAKLKVGYKSNTGDRKSWFDRWVAALRHDDVTGYIRDWGVVSGEL